MLRKTIQEIQVKQGTEKITCLTAYTAPIARLLDEHVDLLLVGDSLGMVLYDYENTLPVTLDQMIEHTKAVMKATSKACVIMDLPFGTYEESKEQAFNSSLKAIKENNANVVSRTLNVGQKYMAYTKLHQTTSLMAKIRTTGARQRKSEEQSIKRNRETNPSRGDLRGTSRGRESATTEDAMRRPCEPLRKTIR